MEKNIEHIRHSLAHLLGAGIMELYPKAKLTLGPAIENGFYYDADIPEKITEADLEKIENKMREIFKTWEKFEKKVLSKEEALEMFRGNEYKEELINEIAEKGEEISIYSSGKFFDLCRGGHVDNIKNIRLDSFKLERIAGAYWRGDEKNKMLTRIYGLAFLSKEELDSYLAQQEEAKKRDHKKLGVELDLFTFSDLVGSGLPLWTPKGTLVRHLLDNYVWEFRQMKKYQKVEIPHITKKELYEKSGHWEKYKDDLFRITTREGHEFAMKPMNCPHHTQIYARKLWSYKELPQRYANTTTCYRDEQTGELSGLSRVRAFAQDDAHVFCRMTDTKEEFLGIWDIVENFYKSFNFELKVRISKHDPSQPEKYLGDKDRWSFAENMLTEIAQSKNVPTYEGIGEAAFYGPKLDFMAYDAIGREWQVATIQLDMNMPERFDLTCINEKGEKERIVMIHAAIMGSIERFMSILIEHTAGNLPVWLSPIQVVITPISEKQNDYSQIIYDKLTEANIRVELDNSNESLGKRIRNAKTSKIPYVIVIGDKEKESKTITVEGRIEKLENISIENFLDKISKEIKERTLN
ncbi:MAG: threonine--tRNA ligase [Candidatus Pacebacteria bacterium]|nr:threonine--tRNA ligase [Candidatus Paceibacterota bacterium]